MKNYLDKFKLSYSLRDRRRFTHKRNIAFRQKMIIINSNSTYNPDLTKSTKIIKGKTQKGKKSKTNSKNPQITTKNKNITKNQSYPQYNHSLIVNLKGQQNIFGKSCELVPNVVYCGRMNHMGGWKLSQSKWANPYKVVEGKSNKEVCKQYEKYLRNSKDLLKDLPELFGKTLACWCKPLPCHTQVILKIMRERGLLV